MTFTQSAPETYDVNDQEKQTFIDSFAPEPCGDQQWDAVFLFEQPEYQDYLAWFWAVFVCDDGELHEEWLNHQRRMCGLIQ